MTYVDYDPKRHKGLPLFERIFNEDGDILYVLVQIGEVLAAKTPWYYVVDEPGVVEGK